MDGVLSPTLGASPDQVAGRLVTDTESNSSLEPLLPFEDFYRGHHRAVANALSITLRSSELGVEAADEGMARAYSRWATVGAYDNPSGWVYRVGLNWARSRIRRLSRRLPWSEKPVYSMPDVGDPAVAAALEKLDLDQRSVVVMRLLLDLSVNETATALDVKPGTVKSRLSRALSTLQVELEGLR